MKFMNQYVISKKNIKRWNSRNKKFIFVFMFTVWTFFLLCFPVLIIRRKKVILVMKIALEAVCAYSGF